MLYAMLLTTAAGLATALGAGLGALRMPGRRSMASVLGFGAGVMVAVSLLDMLPMALERYRTAFGGAGAGGAAASLVLLGMGVAALTERLVPEAELFGGDIRRARALRSALATALALVAHNLPEGAMTLFAGSQDPALGVRLALAVGLHNLPEGLAVAMPVCFSTRSRGRALAAGLAAGLAEPAGALLAWGALGGHVSAGLVAGLGATVSGVMCWVAVSELLPDGFSFGEKRLTAAGFGAGLLVMTLGIALLS